MSKKNINITVGFLFIITIFSSCLKRDLPEYPLWDLNYINNIYVEHRWNGSTNYNGEPIVTYQKMNTSIKVDTAKQEIALTITVPAVSTAFPVDVRNNVAQNKLWVYMDISTAATVKAVDGTPVLGDPTDLTKPQTYEVTAANGQKRKWKVTVATFSK